MSLIGSVVSEEMFENVDGRTEAGVTGILLVTHKPSAQNTHVPIPLAFTKLLQSFESCAEAVEKLVIFRKGGELKRRKKDSVISQTIGAFFFG